MLRSDLGSRDRLLPGAGASLLHLAVAGRLPDPLAVVALDAVVTYTGMLSHQRTDVEQDDATWRDAIPESFRRRDLGQRAVEIKVEERNGG